MPRYAARDLQRPPSNRNEPSRPSRSRTPGEPAWPHRGIRSCACASTAWPRARILGIETFREQEDGIDDQKHARVRHNEFLPADVNAEARERFENAKVNGFSAPTAPGSTVTRSRRGSGRMGRVLQRAGPCQPRGEGEDEDEVADIDRTRPS